MILKILREGLGRVIVFADWLTRPKQMQRSETAQKIIEDKTSNLALYQFYACPFCVKTRRVIRRLNLPIEFRNAQHGSPWRSELERTGWENSSAKLKNHRKRWKRKLAL